MKKEKTIENINIEIIRNSIAKADPAQLIFRGAPLDEYDTEINIFLDIVEEDDDSKLPRPEGRSFFLR